MSVRIRNTQNTDFKEWENIVAKHNKIEDWEVEYGYYENQNHPDSDRNLADIATINEFGSTINNIPSRPFMFQTFTLHQFDKQHMNVYTDMIFNKKPFRSALKEIGGRGVELVEQVIEMGNFVENSALTKELKGSGFPLIDTGYLKANAKSKVVRRTG